MATTDSLWKRILPQLTQFVRNQALCKCSWVVVLAQPESWNMLDNWNQYQNIGSVIFIEDMINSKQTTPYEWYSIKRIMSEKNYAYLSNSNTSMLQSKYRIWPWGNCIAQSFLSLRKHQCNPHWSLINMCVFLYIYGTNLPTKWPKWRHTFSQGGPRSLSRSWLLIFEILDEVSIYLDIK